ncbi:MAG: hypothetical protein KDA88_19230 [Planctomycetaceae bacterium]|nr:hypothetical protein [Planctomycetaceae bacterium]
MAWEMPVSGIAPNLGVAKIWQISPIYRITPEVMGFRRCVTPASAL